jgi:hypothetical protein
MLVLRLTAEGVDMVLFNRDADSDRPFSPNGSERNRLLMSAIAQAEARESIVIT